MCDVSVLLCVCCSRSLQPLNIQYLTMCRAVHCLSLEVRMTEWLFHWDKIQIIIIIIIVYIDERIASKPTEK